MHTCTGPLTAHEARAEALHPVTSESTATPHPYFKNVLHVSLLIDAGPSHRTDPSFFSDPSPPQPGGTNREADSRRGRAYQRCRAHRLTLALQRRRLVRLRVSGQGQG
eukprot:scaffold67428_cov69-Phaeocystis_antarctica.AAC.1